MKAFSLIELMVTLVIIGILGMIATPAYRTYVYNSKLAEAYTGVAAINKAQIVYFSENKAFSGDAFTAYGGGCTPAPGTKAAINPSNVGAQTIFPFANGILSYFSYAQEVYYWDDTNALLGGGQGSFNICASNGSKLGTCSNTPNLDHETWGISQQTKRHWTIIQAAGVLKNIDSDVCSLIFQTIVGDGDKTTSSAVTTFKEQ